MSVYLSLDVGSYLSEREREKERERESGKEKRTREKGI